MTAKRWIVRDSEPEKAARLANVLGISPILADLLIARGYDDELSARVFLTPTYEQLYDPYLSQTTSGRAGESSFGGDLVELE